MKEPYQKLKSSKSAGDFQKAGIAEKGLSSNIYTQNVPGGRLQPTCQLLLWAPIQKIQEST